MRSAILFLVACLALLASCSDDPTAPPDGDPAPTFLPLASRDAVVNNLEVAWNQRRTDKIDELLDDNFTFYFAPGDVGGGLPPSWNRNDEMAATDGLFTSNMVPSPTGPVCKSVRVALQNDELTWVEAGPALLLGEVWYTTTVDYAATFELEPDITIIMVSGSKAELTVRQVGDEWQLIAWRDLGGDFETTSNREVSGEQKSWGIVKSLYGGALAQAGNASTWGAIKSLYRER